MITPEHQASAERRHARQQHMHWLGYIASGQYICPVCDEQLHEHDYCLRAYGEMGFILTTDPYVWTPVPAKYPVHETCSDDINTREDMCSVLAAHWSRMEAKREEYPA